VIDFLPGVKPYESMMVVEFFPSGESMRMVITLDPKPAHEAGLAVRRTEGFAIGRHARGRTPTMKITTTCLMFVGERYRAA
jgi:hypothetical protein